MQLNDILKWTATCLLVVGSGINGFRDLHPIGPLVLLAGGLTWLIVSIRWKEPALIVTNILVSVVSVAGLVVDYHW